MAFGQLQTASLGVASQYQGGAAQDTPRELPAAINHLQNALDSLGSLVDQLDGRLTGIVARAEGPVNAQSSNTPHPVMNTGMGSQLDAMGSMTIQASNRLRSLLERLEF